MGAPFNFLPPGATDLVTPLKCGTIIRCPDLSVKHAVVGKQADLSGSGHTQPRYMLMLTQCCLSVCPFVCQCHKVYFCTTVAIDHHHHFCLDMWP